jgi:MscS family membrane protein
MAALFAIAFMVMRQLFQLINRLTLSHIDKGNDPTSARMVSRILKLTIFMFMVLIFGEHFGIGLSGLLAFGGIGGIAIGVAGKDMLSNLFSGVMLYFDRPFNIGDWVRSPDRQIEGTVVEIGWRITKIMTFDNRPLYVPNAIFSMISVENPGRMTNRHITTTLGLRYEDAAQIGAIIADIRAMLAANKKIDQTQDQLVYFNAFADSSLNIMIDCFTVTTKWAAWLEAQQEVYLNMIAIVQKHGADFAYPTQTLLVNNQQPDISNTSATVK